jgi:glycosyltransferase involved in cell wall biosynthesis
MINSVTILICVHSNNDFHDSLLLKSLESLENQTFKNFKTLIVLDECWDKTDKLILSSIYDLNLTILTKDKKEGLAYAKNFGIHHIDTEWIGFLDADDLYLPTKLEQQVNYIKNNEVDFLGTHCWNINSNDDDNLFPSCFNNFHNITHSDISNKIFTENILTHGSMLIKKNSIIDLGGYQNIRGMEDWDLWKRAINKGYKFHQLPERLYVYRLNTSVTR